MEVTILWNEEGRREALEQGMTMGAPRKAGRRESLGLSFAFWKGELGRLIQIREARLANLHLKSSSRLVTGWIHSQAPAV